MGRPRKTPRRIVSFNLEQATAERIDSLNLANRSEWANRALLEVMDGRLDERQGRHLAELDAREAKGRQDLEDELRNDPFYLTKALRIVINALETADMTEFKPVGRYAVHDLLQRTYLQVLEDSSRASPGADV